VYTSLDGRGRPSRALVCPLDVPRSQHRLLLEEKDESHLLDVASSRDGDWITLSSHSHTCSEVRLWPAASMQAETLLVAPREEGVHYVVEGLPPIKRYKHAGWRMDHVKQPLAHLLGGETPAQGETLLLAPRVERMHYVVEGPSPTGCCKHAGWRLDRPKQPLAHLLGGAAASPPPP
jgi:hypothetical protein